MDEIDRYLTPDDPLWEIEEAANLCHFDAINELVARDANVASQFDPLPNYPQIQILRQVDGCDLTFEINDSSLSFKLVGKLLEVYLYNKNDWKEKPLVARYLLTEAKNNNAWVRLSINDEQPTISMPTSPFELVFNWYDELLNHAIQEYLEEIDRWYRTLEKFVRKPNHPNSLAS